MDEYILAIETSCDDTSVAILKNETILSCVTQDCSFFLNQYGGIVPEIASRKHEEYIIGVFKKALQEAKIDLSNITRICFTKTPGLPGSLHVGEIFAKTLAFLLDLDYVGINHIHSHIFSSFINIKNIYYPFISLIASGKTTSIFLIKSPSEIIELTKTVDDAIGETFDKIGKALGYPYPSGPVIDQNYDPLKTTITFKNQPVKNNFSFSGVKSSILKIINDSKNNNSLDPILVGSSFMKWAINNLIRKLKYYSDLYKISTISIGGGVACNSLFKSEIKNIFKKSYVPLKEYSCDNAAMIGYFFYQKYLNTK